MDLRDRPLSFAKEVFHSTDEEEGAWVPVRVRSVYRDELEKDRIVEDGDNNRKESWETILALLETKCEIEEEQLQFKDQISLNGKGTFSEVWKAQLWDIDVAVKKINLVADLPSSTLSNEVNLLKSLRHPNCVLFVGYTKAPRFSVVTEFMYRGSIRAILDCKEGARFSGSQVFSVALSVARGMNYLHTQSTPIVHGNINSSNILCQENWQIKISDYGMKLLLDPNHPNYGGRIPWRAPEVELDAFPSETASDVFSYGIVLWEIATSEVPYNNWEDQTQLFRAIQRGLRPQIPPTCSPLFRDIMELCWHKDKSKRPTFYQIIEKLRPYEPIVARHMSRQILPKNSSAVDYYECLKGAQKCSELFSLLDDQCLCLKWSFFTSQANQAAIVALLKKDVQCMVSYGNGDIITTDNYGKTTWITSFKTRDEANHTNNIKKRADTLFALSNLVSTPIFMEINTLIQFRVNSRPTHAIEITFKIKNEFRPKSLQVLMDFSIPAYAKKHMEWCGALLLGERYTNYNTILCLFKGRAMAEKTMAKGLVQSELVHYKRYLLSTPIIGKVELLEFSLESRTAGKRPLSANSIQRRKYTPGMPSKGMEPKPPPSSPLHISMDGLVPSKNSLWEKQPRTSNQWKIIIMEPFRQKLKKSKVQSYLQQQRMEPLGLFILTDQQISYHPVGTWHRSQIIVSVNIERARCVPLNIITGVVRLELPEGQIILILETNQGKWALFGLKEHAEIVDKLKKLKITFSRHKLNL